jgi:hypothetical protein
MTLPIRTVLEQLGLRTGALSDDEVLEVATIAVERYGKTNVSPHELGVIANRVIDQRNVREGGGQTVDLAAPVRLDAPPSLTCCRGKRFPGPSGYRLRHTCSGRRGEPYEVVPITSRKRGPYHPACLAAWNDGAEPCAMCLYRLCTDDDCTHDVCQRERGWEEYFG